MPKVTAKEDVWQQKIANLLKFDDDNDNNKCCWPAERCLAALILHWRTHHNQSSRIHHDHRGHHLVSKLSDFAVALLQDCPVVCPDEHDLYLSVVCQWYVSTFGAMQSSNLITTSNNVDHAWADRVGRAIWNSTAWHQYPQQSFSIYHVLPAIDLWLTTVGNISTLNDCLSELIRQLAGGPNDSGRSHSHNVDPITRTAGNGDMASRMMRQTLTALLLQHDDDGDNNNIHHPTSSSWSELAIVLLLRHGRRVMVTADVALVAPTFWKHLLATAAAAPAAAAAPNCRRWTGPVLLELAVRHPDPVVTYMSVHATTSTRQQWCNVVLAYSSSPDNDLRDLAWSALAAWSRIGWEWALVDVAVRGAPHRAHSQPNKNRLGKAHVWCTIARLSVGEYKIQLGQWLTRTVHNYDDDDDGRLHDTCMRQMQACATVLLQSVTLLDRDQHGDLFTMPVLHHYLTTMDEALDMCEQYLSMHADKNVSNKSVTVTVVQIALAVLKLHDPTTMTGDGGGTNHDNDDQDMMRSNKQLHVLRLVLNVSVVEAQNAVLPYLHDLLQSAYASHGGDNDDALPQDLHDYGIVNSDSIVHYLEQFWQHSTDMVAAAAAAGVTELLWQHGITVRGDGLLVALLNWLQQALANLGPPVAPDAHKALQAVIGGIVTLQGESPPSDVDAVVIAQAMELLSATTRP